MKTQSFKFLIMLATVWFAGLMVTSCSDDKDTTPPVDKSSLTDAIAAANTLLSTTSEGVAEGNYLKGSQAPLEAAIAAAQAVADDATVTQETVTNAVVALAAAVTTYESNKVVPIDPDNLIGQWTFDELSSSAVGTTVKDYSSKNNSGTIKAGHEFWGGGVPNLAADRYGNANKALHFDKGSNVEIPYNTGLNPDNISISLWIKQDVNDPIVNNQYMIAMNRWNCYKFNMQDAPKAFFTVHPEEDPGVYYNEDNDTPVLTQGSWYHIAVTFGGGHMTFYLNGVQTKQWDHAGTIINISSAPVNLVFGQDLPSDGYSLSDADPNYLNWGGYFIGTMDEIRIYKSVLTSNQIASIYEVEKP